MEMYPFRILLEYLNNDYNAFKSYILLIKNI